MPENSENLIYDDGLYKNQMAGSLASASLVVAYIVARFGARMDSVVDFGCGAGAWLSVFAQYGRNVRGYDFGHGVPGNLLIPPDKFDLLDLTAPAANLENPIWRCALRLRNIFPKGRRTIS